MTSLVHRARHRLGLAGGRDSAALRYYNSVLTRLPRDRRLVVFESMMGTQFSDSPRAIYDELLRQGVDATPVWSVRPKTPVPTGVPTIVRYTPEWFRALATASVWIDNQGLPFALRKPERVTYVQTWHGTPLKTMGWNDASLAAADATQQASVQAAVNRWDVIPVPSEYFTETIVDAYCAPAMPLKIGLPRNDRLHRRIDQEERRRRLATLGLRDDRRTVLYAPTRKGAGHERVFAAADWPAILSSEPSLQVMHRAHYTDVLESTASSTPQVVDVSTVGDMAELLDVTDVLVTDYSSVLFDFTLTDRPIILFQPDQAEYFAQRGVYFDIRSFSPGPIATTPDELAELVHTVDRWSSSWSSQRAAYRARFGTYERGDSAARVVRDIIVPAISR